MKILVGEKTLWNVFVVLLGVLLVETTKAVGFANMMSLFGIGGLLFMIWVWMKWVKMVGEEMEDKIYIYLAVNGEKSAFELRGVFSELGFWKTNVNPALKRMARKGRLVQREIEMSIHGTNALMKTMYDVQREKA